MRPSELTSLGAPGIEMAQGQTGLRDKGSKGGHPYPGFQPSTLRCMLGVASQLYDTVWMKGFSPRLQSWWSDAREGLLAQGFKQSKADKALLLLKVGSSRGHVLLHPEAVIITSNDHHMAGWVYSYFRQHGQLSDSVQLGTFLGIGIQQSAEGTLWLHQGSLTDRVVAEGGKPQPNWTAVEEGLQVLAACTRPDLVYPLSQVEEALDEDRINLLKAILVQLDETSGLGLV